MENRLDHALLQLLLILGHPLVHRCAELILHLGKFVFVLLTRQNLAFAYHPSKLGCKILGRRPLHGLNSLLRNAFGPLERLFAQRFLLTNDFPLVLNVSFELLDLLLTSLKQCAEALPNAFIERRNVFLLSSRGDPHRGGKLFHGVVPRLELCHRIRVALDDPSGLDSPRDKLEEFTQLLVIVEQIRVLYLDTSRLDDIVQDSDESFTFAL